MSCHLVDATRAHQGWCSTVLSFCLAGVPLCTKHRAAHSNLLVHGTALWRVPLAECDSTKPEAPIWHNWDTVLAGLKIRKTRVIPWYPRKLHLMQHGLNAEISICNYHIQFCPAWLFWAHRLELDSDLASSVWPVQWLSANSSYISKVKLTYRIANQPATLPECKSCRGNQILSTEWVFVLPCAYTHTHTMLIFCLWRFTQSPHKCAHHSFSNPFEVSSIDLTRSEASIVKTSQEWHALQELTAKHKNWKIYSKAHPQSKTRYFLCSIQSGLRQSFRPKPQIQSGLRSWKNKGNLFSNFNRRTFKLVRSVV